jgi:hypothetical protein
MREFHPVDRTRHVNISEKHLDVRAIFESRQCGIRIARLQNIAAGIFNHISSIEADERFVFNHKDD